MNIFSNTLYKLVTEELTPVSYSLINDADLTKLNLLIGKTLKFEFGGQINCIYCKREINKSYGQGFCYACYHTLPQAAPSVMRPELDLSHKGISRNMEWAKENSLVDHFVYLAVSSSLKVGITRHSQIPTRWVDQGASQAIKIAKVPYRQLSGLIEVELKKNFADKTNWRKMLSDNKHTSIDLKAERDKAHLLLKKDFSEYLIDDEITYISYPVEKYPDKVNSISFDKTPSFEAKLVGIKGQYLIFDTNQVLNIRKHSGYHVQISLLD